MTKITTGTYAVPNAVIPRVNVNWLDRALPNPEDQREYSRERVVVAVTEAIAEAMEKADLRRSDIAEKLGKSKSHISQILSGRRNMTLHTLGDVLWACGHELDDLVLSPLGAISCPLDQAWEWYHQSGIALEEIKKPLAAPLRAYACEDLFPPVEVMKTESEDAMSKEAVNNRANTDLALAA